MPLIRSLERHFIATAAQRNATDLFCNRRSNRQNKRVLYALTMHRGRELGGEAIQHVRETLRVPLLMTGDRFAAVDILLYFFRPFLKELLLRCILRFPFSP